MKRPYHSIYDTMRELAEAGDVDGLMESLSGDPGRSCLPEQKGRYLHATIATAAQRDLEGLIEQTLARAIADTAELLARASLLARERTVSDDRTAAGPSLSEPSTVVAERDIERVARLQDRFIALCKARASIQHTQTLSKPVVAAAPGRVIRLDEQRSSVRKKAVGEQ